MTPEQFERLLSMLESLARSLEGSPRRDLQLLLLGGLIGVIGAVFGGIAEALAAYWVSGLRAGRRKREQAGDEAKRKREEWIRKALNWAAMGRKESLRRADLRGADLRGVDLGPGEGREDGADLSFADLSNADLSMANLQRAQLEGANLREVKLYRANLAQAKLWQANLQAAWLANANLQRVNLSGANLRGAALIGAELQDASLCEADLQRANLSAAKLQNTILWRANLQGANLQMANLQTARASKETIWPEGFEVPEGVVMED